MTMVPDHQEKVYVGDGKPSRQFPFAIGGPGSNFAHSQSRGLLLLVRPSNTNYHDSHYIIYHFYNDSMDGSLNSLHCWAIVVTWRSLHSLSIDTKLEDLLGLGVARLGLGVARPLVIVVVGRVGLSTRRLCTLRRAGVEPVPFTCVVVTAAVRVGVSVSTGIILGVGVSRIVGASSADGFSTSLWHVDRE